MINFTSDDIYQQRTFSLIIRRKKATSVQYMRSVCFSPWHSSHSDSFSLIPHRESVSYIFKVLSMTRIRTQICKWYTFDPKQDMLFVSYIKQQIEQEHDQFQIGRPFHV